MVTKDKEIVMAEMEEAAERAVKKLPEYVDDTMNATQLLSAVGRWILDNKNAAGWKNLAKGLANFAQGGDNGQG